METPTLINDINYVKDFCFKAHLDAGLCEPINANANEEDCEAVESVTIIFTAHDGTLLFELYEMALTNVSLENGRFRLEAVHMLESEFAQFQREVESGRVLKHTIRGRLD
ncbi:MAG TPA: hypothetical protein VEG44_01730 [Candidatus Acidoferrales bacterium]|nr:hypothetical protein [Candidatus Acidoferrales bacterium]